MENGHRGTQTTKRQCSPSKKEAASTIARRSLKRYGGDTTKITNIGAGYMGRGIGTSAIAGGHEAEILDRDPAQARALADELGGSASVLDAGSAP